MNDVFGAIRLLLVDDDPAFLGTTTERLRREDDRIEVVTEPTADGGLGRVESGSIDCVVSGHDLSGTDGLGFLDAVRESDPDLPVVLLADDWSGEHAAEALAGGATDVVRRPGDREPLSILANRITHVVGRYRAEQALAAVRERYEPLLEHAAEALCVIDEAGRFTYVNRQWRSQLGFSSSELVGNRAVDYVHPDDRDAVIEAYRRALDELDDPVTVEFRSETAQDGWLWIDTRFRNLADEPVGEGVMALVQATFGRREAERELELELFRQLLDHSSDEIYVIDPATSRLIDANETACERLGYSPAELLELRVVDIAAGIDIDEWPNHADTVREEGGVVFLANHVRSDGSTYPVEVNVVHVEDDDEEFMVSINRDMSERRAQERELLQYRAIVESMDDAVFMIAPDGRFAYVNEAAAANTDVSRDDVVGRRFIDVLEAESLDDERREEFVGLVEEILRGERTTGRRIMEDEDEDGNRRVLDVELLEITSSQQGRIGVAGITRDISERVEHQEALERQNARLDEFASVLSHDLRNPLNVAEGRVRMARRECDSTHLDVANEAHGRMRRLVEDLLTMAREGGSVARTESVSLRDAVERCWGMVDTGDATLTVDDDPRILAQPSRLEQLLENLLRNAVDHGSTDARPSGPEDADGDGPTSPRTQTGKDRAEVDGEAAGVALTVGGLDGGFYVQDDGRGIPTDERDRVFDSGYSTTGEGTGLGLAIVDQIATAHGWSLRLTESQEGGARFEFTGVESADR